MGLIAKARAVLVTPPGMAQEVESPMRDQRICSLVDCNRPLRARGYCATHYAVFMRRGTPHAPPRAVRPVEQRAWAKVQMRDGCWEWRGAVRTSGYGSIVLSPQHSRRIAMAHRVIYESLLGPIPAGLTIDHLCMNTQCVRPDHMEPVTNEVNIMRGMGWGARNARKTHCVRGHALTPDNCSKHKPDVRECRICRNARNRNKRERHPRPLVTHCPHGHEYSGDNLIIHKSGGRRCRACANRWLREYNRKQAQVRIEKL